MKILLVAYVEKDFGTSGYYICETLREMGHEVEVFDYRKKLQNRRDVDSILKMNSELVSKVYKDPPEMLLTFKGELLAPKAVELIGAKTKTVLWHPDEVWFAKWHIELAKRFHHVFTIQDTAMPAYKMHGVENIHYLVEGCYPPLHRPVTVPDEEKQYYGADIMFAGSPYQRNYWLLAIVKFCEEKGLTFKLWGNNWEDEVLRRYWQKRPIYNLEHSKAVSSSRICMNLTSPPPKLGSRPIMEMAMGGLVITEELPCLRKWGFEHEKHLVTFKQEDFQDMFSKIEYYMENGEARKVREKAWRNCHENHTYKNRLTQLLKEVED